MELCEARDWVRRYQAKIGEVGSVKAQSWWEQVKLDIEKKRGKHALETLRRNMYETRRKD
jgi:hypothetical protein